MVEVKRPYLGDLLSNYSCRCCGFKIGRGRDWTEGLMDPPSFLAVSRAAAAASLSFRSGAPRTRTTMCRFVGRRSVDEDQ